MAGPLAFLATPQGQAVAVGGLQFLQGMMGFGAKKQEHDLPRRWAKARRI